MRRTALMDEACNSVTGTDHWRNVAALDEVGVREAILTGYRDGKPFTPYVPTIDIGRGGRVLDFGCGLGRNFPYLTSIADEVVGFDLPEMVARARSESRDVSLEADWSVLAAQRFDLVFASLVFQHIEPAQLRRYLADIMAMTRRCYVLSRGRHDFGGPTLRYVREFAYVPDGVFVEHDPATNALRRVGSISGDEIVELDDARHVEVLID
jgi:SAM-dependent methyltransferase